MKRLLLFTLLVFAFVGAAQAGIIDRYTNANAPANPAAAVDWYAMNWTNTTFNNVVTIIELNLTKNAESYKNITVSLRGANSTNGPLYADLCVGSRASRNTTELSSGSNNFTLYSSCAVTAGTNYFIVMEGTAFLNSSNNTAWRVDTAGTYPRGNRWTSSDSGVTWGTSAGQDFSFRIYNDTVVNNFTITAVDLYDGSTITTFNASVTFNGSTTLYTTTTGSINTSIIRGTGAANITVIAQNYFNKTRVNYDTSNNLGETLYQVEVYFNATTILTGTAVTGFQVTVTNATNNSATPVLYLKAGNYNVTFNKTDWWNSTQQFNYTALQNTTSTFTDVYQYKLNITATNSTGAISTFNVTIIGSSYNASENTATGAILRGWINDSVTVVFSASSNSDTNASSNFTTYTVPALVNITAAMLAYNTFNLTFYNETSNLLLNTTTVSLQVIGDSFAANYTITNGSATISFVTPDDYQLVYWYDEDVPRSYYVTLTDQSFTNLRLYTIDESISSVYLPVEKDAVGEACSDNTVSLMRYYIDINGYRPVEMDKSDTNGQYVLRVQPNIIPYKLIFTGACGNFTSDPQEFTGQTNTFTVTNAQSPLTSLAAIPSVAQSLTFNNATNTFIFTWTDTSNIVTAGCLQVQQWTTGVLSTPYNNCSNSSTGSLVYTVTSTNQTRYVAQSTIETNTEFSEYTDFLEYSFQTAWQSFGLTGIFLTLIVVIAFVGLSLHSPDMTVIAGIGGLAIMGMFGFIAHSYTVIIGMLIIGVIMVYRIRGS